MDKQIKALVIDHFFDQDIDQLRRHLPQGSSLHVVAYQRWAIPARLCFPRSAFTGLEAAYVPSLHRRWRVFSAVAKRQVNWLFQCFQPSILILPTDAIFYFRPYIREFRNLGVPTFVLQKETTISPITMDLHADEVKKWVPPISDFMTVCSERQREFWERAGGEPQLIEITGQPRFDFYSQRFSSEAGSGKPKLLYLSFDDIAYLPDDLGFSSGRSWCEFRREVETTMENFADRFEITIKHHPQQVAKDFIPTSRVTVAPPESDTRQLILGADLVVGFQTTALFEAAIAGKPTIYVGWGETFDEFRSGLVPYEELGGTIRGADSEEMFSAFLETFLDGGSFVDSPGGDDESLLDRYIGPRDGGSSSRVWNTIAKYAIPSTTTAPSRVSLMLRGALLRLVGISANLTKVLLRNGRQQRRLQKAVERVIDPMQEELVVARSRR